ncbi:trafficking protein particle complex subunit 1 isoform X2 [Mauremys reevesii]|uniref:trafficking protein particle complex subunit 1 isoform X2 n=1 Tax=Mauremys reevesii TaxID=260615 RepID=UPI00193FC16C|nr:trafficking protein particle complex subunit 1 isoform X2 [Mauremys reevesii]
MTVHNLYLFDRNGICLHYSEWHRKKQAGISKEEEFKLMYGMLFSMRSFVGKMSPVDIGLKVVMNTDLGVGNIRDVLHQIYSNIYVEFVVKNPLCSLSEPIQSELFRAKLDGFIRGLPFFSARAG